MDNKGHLEDVLQEKALTYKRLFGDEALYQVLKEKEDTYSFMGKDDYIEIAYKSEGEIKHIRLVGDLLEFSDYILTRINSKYKIVVIRKLKGVYYPLVEIEKGEMI